MNLNERRVGCMNINEILKKEFNLRDEQIKVQEAEGLAQCLLDGVTERGLSRLLSACKALTFLQIGRAHV